ncbi:MAG: Ldh family oxidoreductase, partial [Eubacteriales bacterium]|nr:Ldh family oxidoreductase [Eubacteriales bacterium]
INHGNHFGAAGYFTKYAAEHGMIGVSMATANAIVAPTGSKQPMLGTNPLSIAIPAYGKEPFILDMATSVVANGKIKLAAKEGHEIPAGWGMDENGVVTTDPNKVKFLMPFGDYKGYGVSLAIEMLSSVLAMANNSRNAGSFWKPGDGNVQGTGFFVGAINPGAIMDPEEFAKGVAAVIDEMKAAEKADGIDEVLVAGEPEQRKYEKAIREGVYVSDVVIEELKSLADEAGIPFDVAV